MRRLLAGWSTLDPALAWLLRVNLVALATSTALLAAAYVLGFRHTAVEVDLAVLVLSLALMLGTPPLCPRYGAKAAVVGLSLSATVFALGGTWATPQLAPLTAMLTLIPLLVAFPYVSPGWVNALMAVAVLGSAGVAALGEWRHSVLSDESWHVNAAVVAVSMPAVVLVVVFLVRDAYTRLQHQSEQLRESRTHLVQVADAARRSIERDLHDGVQQRLVAMSVTTERARKALENGQVEVAERLVAELAAEHREVLAEMRELARGIYPPLLTERGLAAAVGSAARRSIVPVTLYVRDFERPPAEVEVAAYFCILEALANSAKHSGASEVVVELRADPDLTFVVSDDGCGFDPGTVLAGGLLGMEARVASVGGTLTVESAPGAGTRVRGRFPHDTTAQPGRPRWTGEVNDR